MNNHSIILQGKQFSLSPLNLGDLRRLEPSLLGLEARAQSGFATMLSLVPVIHASLRKLHTELTVEELEDIIDLNVFPELLDRVLEISGLKRNQNPGEAAPQQPGEAAGENPNR
jgi:hypothetical protein